MVTKLSKPGRVFDGGKIVSNLVGNLTPDLQGLLSPSHR
jgi:hypothetical protein